MIKKILVIIVLLLLISIATLVSAQLTETQGYAKYKGTLALIQEGDSKFQNNNLLEALNFYTKAQNLLQKIINSGIYSVSGEGNTITLDKIQTLLTDVSSKIAKVLDVLNNNQATFQHIQFLFDSAELAIKGGKTENALKIYVDIQRLVEEKIGITRTANTLLSDVNTGRAIAFLIDAERLKAIAKTLSESGNTEESERLTDKAYRTNQNVLEYLGDALNHNSENTAAKTFLRYLQSGTLIPILNAYNTQIGATFEKMDLAARGATYIPSAINFREILHTIIGIKPLRTLEYYVVDPLYYEPAYGTSYKQEIKKLAEQLEGLLKDVETSLIFVIDVMQRYGILLNDFFNVQEDGTMSVNQKTMDKLKEAIKADQEFGWEGDVLYGVDEETKQKRRNELIDERFDVINRGLIEAMGNNDIKDIILLSKGTGHYQRQKMKLSQTFLVKLVKPFEFLAPPEDKSIYDKRYYYDPADESWGRFLFDFVDPTIFLGELKVGSGLLKVAPALGKIPLLGKALQATRLLKWLGVTKSTVVGELFKLIPAKILSTKIGSVKLIEMIPFNRWFFGHINTISTGLGLGLLLDPTENLVLAHMAVLLYGGKPISELAGLAPRYFASGVLKSLIRHGLVTDRYAASRLEKSLIQKLADPNAKINSMADLKSVIKLAAEDVGLAGDVIAKDLEKLINDGFVEFSSQIEKDVLENLLKILSKSGIKIDDLRGAFGKALSDLSADLTPEQIKSIQAAINRRITTSGDVVDYAELRRIVQDSADETLGQTPRAATVSPTAVKVLSDDVADRLLRKFSSEADLGLDPRETLDSLVEMERRSLQLDSDEVFVYHVSDLKYASSISRRGLIPQYSGAGRIGGEATDDVADKYLPDMFKGKGFKRSGSVFAHPTILDTGADGEVRYIERRGGAVKYRAKVKKDNAIVVDSTDIAEYFASMSSESALQRYWEKAISIDEFNRYYKPTVPNRWGNGGMVFEKISGAPAHLPNKFEAAEVLVKGNIEPSHISVEIYGDTALKVLQSENAAKFSVLVSQTKPTIVSVIPDHVVTRLARGLQPLADLGESPTRFLNDLIELERRTLIGEEAEFVYINKELTEVKGILRRKVIVPSEILTGFETVAEREAAELSGQFLPERLRGIGHNRANSIIASPGILDTASGHTLRDGGVKIKMKVNPDKNLVVDGNLHSSYVFRDFNREKYIKPYLESAVTLREFKNYYRLKQTGKIGTLEDTIFERIPESQIPAELRDKLPLTIKNPEVIIQENIPVSSATVHEYGPKVTDVLSKENTRRLSDLATASTRVPIPKPSFMVPDHIVDRIATLLSRHNIQLGENTRGIVDTLIELETKSLPGDDVEFVYHNTRLGTMEDISESGALVPSGQLTSEPAVGYIPRSQKDRVIDGAAERSLPERLRGRGIGRANSVFAHPVDFDTAVSPVGELKLDGIKIEMRVNPDEAIVVSSETATNAIDDAGRIIRNDPNIVNNPSSFDSSWGESYWEEAVTLREFKAYYRFKSKGRLMGGPDSDYNLYTTYERIEESQIPSHLRDKLPTSISAPEVLVPGRVPLDNVKIHEYGGVINKVLQAENAKKFSNLAIPESAPVRKASAALGRVVESSADDAIKKIVKQIPVKIPDYQSITYVGRVEAIEGFYKLPQAERIRLLELQDNLLESIQKYHSAIERRNNLVRVGASGPGLAQIGAEVNALQRRVNNLVDDIQKGLPQKHTITYAYDPNDGRALLAYRPKNIRTFYLSDEVVNHPNVIRVAYPNDVHPVAVTVKVGGQQKKITKLYPNEDFGAKRGFELRAKYGTEVTGQIGTQSFGNDMYGWATHAIWPDEKRILVFAGQGSDVYLPSIFTKLRAGLPEDANIGTFLAELRDIDSVLNYEILGSGVKQEIDSLIGILDKFRFGQMHEPLSRAVVEGGAPTGAADLYRNYLRLMGMLDSFRTDDLGLNLIDPDILVKSLLDRTFLAERLGFTPEQVNAVLSDPVGVRTIYDNIVRTEWHMYVAPGEALQSQRFAAAVTNMLLGEGYIPHIISTSPSKTGNLFAPKLSNRGLGILERFGKRLLNSGVIIGQFSVDANLRFRGISRQIMSLGRPVHGITDDLLKVLRSGQLKSPAAGRRPVNLDSPFEGKQHNNIFIGLGGPFENVLGNKNPLLIFKNNVMDRPDFRATPIDTIGYGNSWDDVLQNTIHNRAEFESMYEVYLNNRGRFTRTRVDSSGDALEGFFEGTLEGTVDIGTEVEIIIVTPSDYARIMADGSVPQNIKNKVINAADIGHGDNTLLAYYKYTGLDRFIDRPFEELVQPEFRALLPSGDLSNVHNYQWTEMAQEGVPQGFSFNSLLVDEGGGNYRIVTQAVDRTNPGAEPSVFSVGYINDNPHDFLFHEAQRPTITKILNDRDALPLPGNWIGSKEAGKVNLNPGLNVANGRFLGLIGALGIGAAALTGPEIALGADHQELPPSEKVPLYISLLEPNIPEPVIEGALHDISLFVTPAVVDKIVAIFLDTPNQYSSDLEVLAGEKLVEISGYQHADRFTNQAEIFTQDVLHLTEEGKVIDEQKNRKFLLAKKFLEFKGKEVKLLDKLPEEHVCNEVLTPQSGKQGTYEQYWELGTNKGEFNLQYNFYRQPDKIEIYYENNPQPIFRTDGFVSCDRKTRGLSNPSKQQCDTERIYYGDQAQSTESECNIFNFIGSSYKYKIPIPQNGTSTKVKAVVTAPCGTTSWIYKISCPEGQKAPPPKLSNFYILSSDIFSDGLRRTALKTILESGEVIGGTDTDSEKYLKDNSVFLKNLLKFGTERQIKDFVNSKYNTILTYFNSVANKLSSSVTAELYKTIKDSQQNIDLLGTLITTKYSGLPEGQREAVINLLDQLRTKAADIYGYKIPMLLISVFGYEPADSVRLSILDLMAKTISDENIFQVISITSKNERKQYSETVRKKAIEIITSSGDHRSIEVIRDLSKKDEIRFVQTEAVIDGSATVLPPETLDLNKPITMQFTSQQANKNPSTIDRFDATIASDEDIVSVPMVETGPNTGVFVFGTPVNVVGKECRTQTTGCPQTGINVISSQGSEVRVSIGGNDYTVDVTDRSLETPFIDPKLLSIVRSFEASSSPALQSLSEKRIIVDILDAPITPTIKSISFDKGDVPKYVSTTKKEITLGADNFVSTIDYSLTSVGKCIVKLKCSWCGIKITSCQHEYATLDIKLYKDGREIDSKTTGRIGRDEYGVDTGSLTLNKFADKVEVTFRRLGNPDEYKYLESGLSVNTYPTATISKGTELFSLVAENGKIKTALFGAVSNPTSRIIITKSLLETIKTTPQDQIQQTILAAIASGTIKVLDSSGNDLQETLRRQGVDLLSLFSDIYGPLGIADIKPGETKRLDSFLGESGILKAEVCPPTLPSCSGQIIRFFVPDSAVYMGAPYMGVVLNLAGIPTSSCILNPDSFPDGVERGASTLVDCARIVLPVDEKKTVLEFSGAETQDFTPEKPGSEITKVVFGCLGRQPLIPSKIDYKISTFATFASAPSATSPWVSGGVGDIAMDSSGNLYTNGLIGNDNMIIKINNAGQITHLPYLNGSKLTVDLSDNLYVIDGNTVKRLSPDGIITTVAGTGKRGMYYEGDPDIQPPDYSGQAIEANLDLEGQSDITVDSNGNLYILDGYAIREKSGNYATSFQLIRKVDSNEMISTIGAIITNRAGKPTKPKTIQNLRGAINILADDNGNIYASTIGSSNQFVKKISPDGTITTVAGTGERGFSGDGGPATQAKVSNPRDMVLDAAGNLYLVDSDNFRIRKIDSNGIITTVAGSGNNIKSGDGGLAIAAGMGPYSLDIDSSGNLFLSDSYSIRKLTPISSFKTTLVNGGDDLLETILPAGLSAPTSLLPDRKIQATVIVKNNGIVEIGPTVPFRLDITDEESWKSYSVKTTKDLSIKPGEIKVEDLTFDIPSGIGDQYIYQIVVQRDSRDPQVNALAKTDVLMIGSPSISSTNTIDTDASHIFLDENGGVRLPWIPKVFFSVNVKNPNNFDLNSVSVKALVTISDGAQIKTLPDRTFALEGTNEKVNIGAGETKVVDFFIPIPQELKDLINQRKPYYIPTKLTIEKITGITTSFSVVTLFSGEDLGEKEIIDCQEHVLRINRIADKVKLQSLTGAGGKATIYYTDKPLRQRAISPITLPPSGGDSFDAGVRVGSEVIPENSETIPFNGVETKFFNHINIASITRLVFGCRNLEFYQIPEFSAFVKYNNSQEKVQAIFDENRVEVSNCTKTEVPLNITGVDFLELNSLSSSGGLVTVYYKEKRPEIQSSPRPSSSPTPITTLIKDCIDSDDGMNSSVKGTITSGNTTWQDYCISSNSLQEGYCYLGDIKTTTMYCSGGCEEGACKPERAVKQVFDIELKSVSYIFKQGNVKKFSANVCVYGNQTLYSVLGSQGLPLSLDIIDSDGSVNKSIPTSVVFERAPEIKDLKNGGCGNFTFNSVADDYPVYNETKTLEFVIDKRNTISEADENNNKISCLDEICSGQTPITETQLLIDNLYSIMLNYWSFDRQYRCANDKLEDMGYKIEYEFTSGGPAYRMPVLYTSGGQSCSGEQATTPSTQAQISEINTIEVKRTPNTGKLYILFNFSTNTLTADITENSLRQYPRPSNVPEKWHVAFYANSEKESVTINIKRPNQTEAVEAYGNNFDNLTYATCNQLISDPKTFKTGTIGVPKLDRPLCVKTADGKIFKLIEDRKTPDKVYFNWSQLFEANVTIQNPGEECPTISTQPFSRPSQTIQTGCETPTNNTRPFGIFEKVGIDNQTGIQYLQGWAYDADSSEKSVDVEIQYTKGVIGSSKTVTANLSRQDLVDSYSIPNTSINHGFRLPLTGIEDGTYTIRMFAKDSQTYQQEEIRRSPQEILINISRTDLSLIGASMVSSDWLTLQVCVYGPKTIDDLKANIPDLNGFPWKYEVIDSSGSKKQHTEQSQLGTRTKNGGCFYMDARLSAEERFIYEITQKINVIVDPSNLIQEIDETNNQLNCVAGKCGILVVQPSPSQVSGPAPTSAPAVCSGDVVLTLSKNQVTTSESFKATVSGLSSCDGRNVYIWQESTRSTQGWISCSVSGSGCSVDIKSPSVSNKTYITKAAIDRNQNGNYADSGEMTGSIYYKVSQVVTSPSPTSTQTPTPSPTPTFTPAPINSQLAKGVILTVAGNISPGYLPDGKGDGGQATQASITPYGVAIDSSGNLYIADVYNALRKVDKNTGLISTVTGYVIFGSQTINTTLQSVVGLSIDQQDNIYATTRKAIYKYSKGLIEKIAGHPEITGFSGDGGPAYTSQLNGASSTAVDSVGNIYIADTDNRRIRKIDKSTGIINTIAGTGQSGIPADGQQATTANLNKPIDVALDSIGNIYVVDNGGHAIYKIDKTNGTISRFAGRVADIGDDYSHPEYNIFVQAKLAGLRNPTEIYFDKSDNLYIVDRGNNKIKKVEKSTGFIYNVAGTGVQGYSGDNGPATSAQLWNPYGIAVDSSGNLYISELTSHVVRKIGGPV